MRKSKFSEHQIIATLKAVEAGRTVKKPFVANTISALRLSRWKPSALPLGTFLAAQKLTFRA
jgi:hypothetical protein